MEDYYQKGFNPYQYHTVTSSVNSDHYPSVHSGIYCRETGKNAFRSRSNANRVVYLSKKLKQSSNNLEKCFKYLRFLVVSVCVCTFFYYVVEFFGTFQQYPTVVDVNVEFNDLPDLPAITICNHNLYMRSKFCPTKNSTFALLCQTPTPYTSYTNHTELIKMFTRLSDSQTVRNLSQNESMLFKQCILKTEWSSKPYEQCKKPLWINVNGRNCFVLNAMWFEERKEDVKRNDTEFEMVLDLEPGEYLIDPNKPAVEVYIHSRTAIPDSRTSRFMAKGGNSYDIGILKTSLLLLEPPYQTACRNYSDEFRKSGGKQTSANRRYIDQQETSLGKSVCEKLCMIKESMDRFKCIPSCLPFTSVLQKCVGNAQEQRKKCLQIRNLKAKCVQKCPSECRVQMYDIHVDENDGFFSQSEETTDANGTDSTTKGLQEVKNFTKITIALQLIRHSIYSHKAKITSVEILGYVGGYLGIFLGVSIPMLFDTCVTLVSCIHQRYHKRALVKSMTKRPAVIQY